MTARIRTHGMAGFRTDEIAARGRKAQDHRASCAQAGTTRNPRTTRHPLPHMQMRNRRGSSSALG